MHVHICIIMCNMESNKLSSISVYVYIELININLSVNIGTVFYSW